MAADSWGVRSVEPMQARFSFVPLAGGVSAAQLAEVRRAEAQRAAAQ